MKKIFENFYVFSKLTFTLVLLVCLLGALYIIYINYQSEDEIFQKQAKFERELKENIDKNYKLISEFADQIKNYELTLNEIKKSLELLKGNNQNDDISIINENLKFLNDNMDNLSKDIQNLKNDNLFTSQKNIEETSNFKNKNINEIIDLILLKYENTNNFEKELEYLNSIITDKENINFEKIYILASKPFKGYDYLKTTIDKEINHYLKNKITENPDSLFSKVLLPYINISPSSQNKITNDIILKLKKINLDIENRNIEKAFKNLKTIDQFENNFKLSSLELQKYLEFKTTLYGLK